MSRHLKPLALPLALCACGFTPLYGTGGGNASVADRLDQVQIANIPERTGQLLRQSLQEQFQAAGAPRVQRYTLNVSYNINTVATGEQQDTSVTRFRFAATANWWLSPAGAPASRLAAGQAVTEDALNIIDEQYFAQELETNTVDQQLADEIAAQITAQVAVYFKTHG